MVLFLKNPAKAVTQNITSPALMCLPSRSSSVKVVLTELGKNVPPLITKLFANTFFIKKFLIYIRKSTKK